jgi:hypothetical protein
MASLDRKQRKQKQQQEEEGNQGNSSLSSSPSSITLTSLDLSANKVQLTGAKVLRRLLELGRPADSSASSELPTGSELKTPAVATMESGHQPSQQQELEIPHTPQQALVSTTPTPLPPSPQVSSPLTLTELDLSDNRLGDLAVAEIAQGLTRNKVCRRVNLSHNKVHILGAEAIARMVSRNDSLECIGLGCNSIGGG